MYNIMLFNNNNNLHWGDDPNFNQRGDTLLMQEPSPTPWEEHGPSQLSASHDRIGYNPYPAIPPYYIKTLHYMEQRRC